MTFSPGEPRIHIPGNDAQLRKNSPAATLTKNLAFLGVRFKFSTVKNHIVANKPPPAAKATTKNIHFWIPCETAPKAPKKIMNS